MTRLNLRDKPGLLKAVADGRVDFAESGLSIGRVLTIIVALLGWGWALVGSGTGVVAKDYVSVRDRVTALETARAEDLRALERQHEDDRAWRETVDRKLDNVLSRLPRVR